MNYGDQNTRIRRFLRDPDANIWSDDLVLRIYNDSQRWVQQQTQALEDITAIRIPPMFNISYLFDWEWRYFDSSQGRNYQALRYHHQSDCSFCYRWEAEILSGQQGTVGDEGDHYSQPWEGFVSGITPGDPIPIWFPNDFDRASVVAWDRRPLEYIDRKTLMSEDSTWVTHMGHDAYYYRYNDIDNCFVLTPLPSAVDWVDVSETVITYTYTFSWEPDETYISSLGDGAEFTSYNSLRLMEYVYPWENEHLNGGECLGTDELALHGMFAGELPSVDSGEGILVTISGYTDLGSSTGGVVDLSGTVFNTDDSGVALQSISDSDNILLIYRKEPTDIMNWEEESVFPSFLQKYIEHDALSRLYTVDNDGKIDSLRDYWQYRSKLGIEIIKKFMVLRKQDRDYRLVTPGIPGRRTRRHARLPDAYPAI